MRLEIPIRRRTNDSSSPTSASEAASSDTDCGMTTKQQNERSTATTVRRNLFSHPAMRRPVHNTSSTSPLQVASEEADAEMVARDKDGNYVLDQPTITPMPRDNHEGERG